MQKRVLTIQDISCIGRCSLTVALPILSAAGLETAILPTAVLSTHTAGFSGYTFRDLTDDIQPIFDHWKATGFDIAALYSGYLGSFEQLRLVGEMFDYYKAKGAMVIVDPAMADNGKYYPAFDAAFGAGMAKLAAKADVVVPNLTEAAFMLGEDVCLEGYDKAYIEGLMARLAALGPTKVVLTGVSFEDGKLGAASYDAVSGEICYYFQNKIDGYFHGTGDVYASVMVGALMNGKTVHESAAIAVDFTVSSLKKTMAMEEADKRCGVDFEETLPEFMRALGRI